MHHQANFKGQQQGPLSVPIAIFYWWVHYWADVVRLNHALSAQLYSINVLIKNIVTNIVGSGLC